MPEAHLKDLKVDTYSACGPFARHKDRFNKFIQTDDTNYIYKNEQDKACFAHDAAYSDFKDIKNRTAADKILKDKAYEIAKDSKYCGSSKHCRQWCEVYTSAVSKYCRQWCQVYTSK